MRLSTPPSLSLLLLLLSLFSLASFSSAGIGKNAMLLQDVSSLVFTKGEMTNARRSSPVPQMSCKSGPCQYAPTSALCRNAGFDGVDVTWKCEAELPKGVRFGKVDVSCEGFASRDDEHVLKGSCGLEYGLQGEPTFESEEREEDSWVNRNVRHNAGEKKHDSKVHDTRAYDRAYDRAAPSSASSWLSWLTDSSSQAKDYAYQQYNQATNPLHPAHSQSTTGIFGLVSWLLSSLFSMGIKFIGALIILYLVYKLMRPSTISNPTLRQQQQPGLFRSLLGGLPFSSLLGGLLGGGQSSNAYGAPPPYPGSDSAPGYNPSSYSKYSQQQQAPPSQQQQGSGFGVMHGLLGGSLLGYLMGRRRAAPAAASVQTERAGYGGYAGQTARAVPRNAVPVQSQYRADGRAYEASTTEVPDVRTTETSTAYARTTRR